MLTLPELRDTDFTTLDTAGEAWTTFGKTMQDLTAEASTDLIAPLRNSGWAGPAATTALFVVDKVDDEFEVAAMALRTIGSTLGGVADELQSLQTQLRTVLRSAAAEDFTVDDDGTVHPPQLSFAESHDPDAGQVVQHRNGQARTFADRIGALLTRADEADSHWSRVLDALITQVPGQEAYEYGDATDDNRLLAGQFGLHEGAIPAAGAGPAAVDSWWRGLTPHQRELYLNAWPGKVGALDGIPTADRDTANRLALRDLIGDDVNTRQDRDNPQHDAAMILLDKLEAGDADPPGQRLYLLSFDGSADGKAAVSIGDPDTADRTAVLVPGVGTELTDIRGLLNRSADIQAAAGELDRDSSVAVVGWLGYDTPNIDASIGTALTGGQSRAGATALDGFVDGLHTTHQGGPDHITAIGHSYGSTVPGEASSTGDGLRVDDIVAVGSPGMRVDHAADLKIASDHVWAGAAADDNFVARPENTASKISFWGDDIGELANRTIHGPGPHYPEFGGNVLTIDTHGHSGYWDRGSQSLANQAAIVLGDYEAVRLDHGKAPA
ncbi:alpha/beta hydrolase [Micromonosporaceae bacterium Da 78-11]